MASLNRRDSFDKRVFVALGVLLAAAVLLCAGISLLPQIHGMTSGRDLTSNVTIDVTRSNGTTITGGGSTEWHGRKGDEIVLHVQMPPMSAFENACLTFSAYNCQVEMICGGVPVPAQIIVGGEQVDVNEYLKNLADRGRSIGHMEFMVPVPDYAWGGEITINLKPQTGVTFQIFDRFLLVPGTDARFAPVRDHEGQFLIYGALALLGLLGLIAGLAGLVFRPEMLEVALGSTFMMLSSIWFFASRGFMFAIFENVRLCSLTEYYAMLAAPVALAFYMWACVEDSFHKQVSRVVGITFAVTAAVISLIDLLGGASITDLMLPFSVMLIAALIIFLALLIRDFHEFSGDQRGVVVFTGTTIAIVLMMFELIGNCLECIGTLPAAVMTVARVDFSAAALITGYAIIVFSRLTNAQHVIAAAVRKETLEQMAKIDPMTELPTRAAVIEDIGRLRMKDRYAILFMDVTGINIANEKYGHETGDKLIKIVADAVRSTFDQGGYDGFYGRWGGDEFVVFVREYEDAEEYRTRFREKIRELNEGKLRSGLPFRIEVPVGVSFHARNESRTIKQCLDDAQHQMFVDKLNSRMSR